MNEYNTAFILITILLINKFLSVYLISVLGVFGKKNNFI